MHLVEGLKIFVSAIKLGLGRSSSNLDPPETVLPSIPNYAEFEKVPEAYLEFVVE
jgi:hypothetical protein